MKLGLDSYSTRNSGLDPAGVLALAHELGLEGVLFEPGPFTSFRQRDLDAVRRRAEELGLYVELGMGSIFRWHPMAEKGRNLLADAGCDVAVSEAQIVIEHLKVARRLGSPLLRCVGGNLFVRDEGHDMARLADQAVDILREACRAAGDMGMHIAMENHADFTVRELAGIRARVGSPAFGFTLDCANLAFDLDDPVRLARIMAPYSQTTHFKNYRVIRTRRGLALENCSLGEGEIDLPAIAEILAAQRPTINLNIEIHTQFAPFTLDILDKTFFQRHPSPPGDGLAWYLQAAWNKAIPEALPANLPDGQLSWQREQEDVRQSVRWAREKLPHLFSRPVPSPSGRGPG
ncbi:MAG: sugar phosphate isomerase/epimerase [Thermoguttaceae bacterium]|jgi:sugar phosphate isomerase/epimerase